MRPGISAAVAMALVRELAAISDASKDKMLADFKAWGVDQDGNPLTVRQGRNAAKRARRAISNTYKGPAKTPKGLKGK